MFFSNIIKIEQLAHVHIAQFFSEKNGESCVMIVMIRLTVQ